MKLRVFPSIFTMRRVLGIALVIASLVAGIVVIGNADQREPVVVATRDIAPGVPITLADVTIAALHLGPSSALYAHSIDEVIGHSVDVMLEPGALVRRTVAIDQLPVVTVPMRPSFLPKVERGTTIDIWATFKDQEPVQVAQGVAVVAIDRGSATTAISVAVDPAQVPMLIGAAESAQLSIVQR